MSKCPFWSTSKERVNCYSECPMHSQSGEIEMCFFKEILPSTGKTSYEDSFSEDLFYSQDRYSSFDEDERVINY